MKSDPLTSLLAAGAADDPERSPPCPDEHQIAGFADGGLDAAAREQVALHLADCAHCLALVALLSRERQAAESLQVPQDAVARALSMVARRPSRRWFMAPQWAAAAALLLAVPLLVQVGRNLDGGIDGEGRAAPPVTRTLAPRAAGLQVLAPGSGSTVDARRLSFRWTEVQGTPYYDVRIVTDAGDVVAEERVTGTSWQPSVPLHLEQGAEYFVHVEAYPSGDKAVSSDHVPFRVSN